MDTVYLDNSATSFPKPSVVYDAMEKAAREFGVNSARGGYSLAQTTAGLIRKTRSSLAELVGLPTGQQIVLTPSATIGLNTVLFGLEWNSGDNVYLTPFEHNGVLRPLYHLRESRGIKLWDIPVERDSLIFDLDALKECFEKNKPKLVVVNHGSNVCGLVAPIEQIALLAKRYDALMLVDAAQTLGVFDIDMGKWQLDFVVFAGHKSLFGPIGVGGIAINSCVQLKPFIYGGTGSESELEDMPTDYPERLEAGSPNIVAIAGLCAGIEHVRENAHLKSRERQLFSELINVLNKYPEIKVYLSNCVERRLSVLSCTVAGYTPVEFATVLDQHFGIAVRAGLHCAPRAHQFLGTAPLGAVRFSLGPGNTDEDIDAVSNALEQLFAM